MELYRLHCFEVVVEEGGFKRATARLHITQPALSYQIKQLESELEVQLLYRRPGGVCPTEAGRVLYQHAQQVRAAVRQAQRAVKELNEGTAGEVRIGAVNSVGIYFLPSVLWAMRERAPGIRPTVLYRDSDDIIEALLGNQLDFATLADPVINKRLHYEVLLEEQVSLVMGRDHPLFGNANIRPEQLNDLVFVGLSPRTPTGALIRDYLRRLGVLVEPVVQTDNIETVRRMVEMGMGVAFLPDMVTEEDVVSRVNPQGRLSRARLTPPLTRKIQLVSWDELQPSRAVATFIGAIRDFARASPTRMAARALSPPFASPAEKELAAAVEPAAAPRGKPSDRRERSARPRRVRREAR